MNKKPNIGLLLQDINKFYDPNKNDNKYWASLYDKTYIQVLSRKDIAMKWNMIL